MGTYKGLYAWQKSMELSEMVYLATRSFPQEEKYALADQMRRASVSIVSNIAEGFGRGTDKDIAHFLYMAKGSSNELDTQIELSFRLKFIDNNVYISLRDKNMEVNKMLASLIYRRENGLDTIKR